MLKKNKIGCVIWNCCFKTVNWLWTWNYLAGNEWMAWRACSWQFLFHILQNKKHIFSFSCYFFYLLISFHLDFRFSHCKVFFFRLIVSIKGISLLVETAWVRAFKGVTCLLSLPNEMLHFNHFPHRYI